MAYKTNTYTWWAEKQKHRSELSGKCDTQALKQLGKNEVELTNRIGKLSERQKIYPEKQKRQLKSWRC